MQIQHEYTSSSLAYTKAFLDCFLRAFFAVIIGFVLLYAMKSRTPFYVTIAVYFVYVLLHFINTASKRLLINDEGVWMKRGCMPWNNQIEGVNWSNLQSVEVVPKKMGNKVTLHQKEGNKTFTINNIKNAGDAMRVINQRLK